MTLNYIILTSTEDTIKEKNLIEELIGNINRKLSSRHTWIDLITPPLPETHYEKDIDGNGIHLALTSLKEFPDTIEKALNPMPSLPEPTRRYILIKEDGSEKQQKNTESHATQLGKGHTTCTFSNDDTLRTYATLLLEPTIRQITGEDVIRYSDGAIYALGIHIANLNGLSFVANNHGLRELMRNQEKPKKTIPDECYRRYFMETTAGNELRRILHAALRIMDLSMSDTLPLMLKVKKAFEKGDVNEAERLVGSGQTMTGMNAETHILSINRMVLRAALCMAHTSIPIDERAEKARTIFEKALSSVRNPHDPSFARLMAEYSAFLWHHAGKSEDLTKVVNAGALLWHATSDMAENVATTYRNIAEACNARGDSLNALEHYKKALDTLKRTLGERHPAIASVSHAMAKAILPLGFYPKALELLQRARDIREESLGEWNSVTAATYDDIASTLHRMGDNKQALAFYKRAAEIHEKTLGDCHPKTAASYTKTGFVFYNQQEFGKAKRQFLKALAIYERTPETSFPEMVALYGHVADTCYNMGDYARASEFYTKQLDSQMTESGVNDTKTASLYSSVGNCHLLLEEYEKAAACYGKALAVRKRLFGDEDKNTASSYYDLGTAYACLKDYPKALDYFRKSLETRQRTLGGKHADTCASCWKVGLIYFQMRDFKASLPYLERTAEYRRTQLGADNPKTAEIYSDLGYAHLNLMEHGRALDYFRKAAEIQERVLGEDNPKYKSACFFYAKLLETGNKGDEAVTWGRKAVKAFPKNTDALSFLASSCVKTGRYEEAMRHYERCLKLRHQRGDSIDCIRETEALIKQLKVIMRSSTTK